MPQLRQKLRKNVNGKKLLPAHTYSMNQVKNQIIFVHVSVPCARNWMPLTLIGEFQDYTGNIKIWAKRLLHCIVCSGILTEGPCLKHTGILSEIIEAAVLRALIPFLSWKNYIDVIQMEQARLNI